MFKTKIKYRYARLDAKQAYGAGPGYAREGDAGFDLRVIMPPGVAATAIDAGETKSFNSGVALEVIPHPIVGWVAKLLGLVPVLKVYPRSGLGINGGIILANTVGIIDSGYRGEMKIALKNTGRLRSNIVHGARVCQAILSWAAAAEFEEVDTLGTTVRGDAGFGSTGVK